MLLFGPIPTEIGQLAALEELDMASCFFSGTIPTEIGLLRELRKLRLIRNAPLTGTLPTELGALTRLEVLSVAFNQLSGTIPTELGNLSSLQEVQLGQNALTGAVPEELCLIAADPALALNTLVVDCSGAVTCAVPECCSSCETVVRNGEFVL